MVKKGVNSKSKKAVSPLIGYVLLVVFAIILSIGFFSHLIGDSLTHRGIMPFWPLKRPKFNGPIKTGGFGEYLVILVLLLLIYWAGSFI